MTQYVRTQTAETICLGARERLADGAPLVTPIFQTSSFARDGVSDTAPHQYSRVSNPTVGVLEQRLGELEDALPAVSFSTGLAAETALFLTLLKQGDHLICGQSIYGGTTRLLREVLPGLGIECTFVNTTTPRGVRAALRPNTKLVFIESPTNPTLELADITALSTIAHAHRALLAVDNTFLTAVLQQPLELGADISVYSTTKLIDGHSSALGGAIVTRDAALADRLRRVRKCTGGIQTPFGAWVTLQGLKTLPVRIRQQSRTAERVARWLAADDRIERVCYPSLSGHPGSELAATQHLGAHGTVIALEVRGGLEVGRELARAVRLARAAEHVGSVETLLTHPATMTHGDVPRDQREAAGLTDGLLRLSIGLEPADAIIDDLDQALDVASRTRKEASECAAAASSF